jgi:hypothetical protein
MIGTLDLPIYIRTRRTFRQIMAIAANKPLIFAADIQD